MNSIFKITGLDKLKKQDMDLFDSITRNNISSGRTPMEILKHCYSGEYDRCADMIRKITKKVPAERLEFDI